MSKTLAPEAAAEARRILDAAARRILAAKLAADEQQEPRP
jgi:hypothetical protein